MPRLPRTVFILLFLGALLVGGRGLIPAAGGASQADEELSRAVERGRKIFEQVWKGGEKTCAACHARGPNRMHAGRVNRYPAWDRAFKKVVNVQQKINQMIETKSHGKAFALGSDELNALEAYLKTLR